jgi:hypothetical protein
MNSSKKALEPNIQPFLREASIFLAQLKLPLLQCRTGVPWRSEGKQLQFWMKQNCVSLNVAQ